MADIIQLLPDNVANQIAAGEVVQRPASAVKELMENAIDAGATTVRVVIKDAGKTLIQVLDNGSGMSDTDARMSFERHATSKIRKSEDLFHIVTKGFRGEALASIAAVAQVEMRTKIRGATLGTRIEIEGSRVLLQEVDSCPEGTNFSIKNLFFNVPARRYFLKGDAIEFRHIIDEFQRVALTHSDVEFALTHNGSEVFSLSRTTLRQRIVHVFGARYNEKLVPVEEFTDIVKVSGYVGKPDMSKKTRGDQFFFLNNRFIRNSYLHHAVMNAFEGLIPSGHFPLYLIYIEIDPAQIDINIHPTKTEVKFQDERAVYAILHAAVKRALGRHNIAPTLDFDQETAIQISPLHSGVYVRQPEVRINPDFNPFERRETDGNQALKSWFDQREKKSADGWQDLMGIQSDLDRVSTAPDIGQIKLIELSEEGALLQLNRRYILSTSSQGIVVIDQQRAHERVLFEQYLRQMERGEGMSQQLLFPEQMELQAAEASLLKDRMHEMAALGFDLQFVSDREVNILGIPPEIPVSGTQPLIQQFIQLVMADTDSPEQASFEKMAWSLARSSSIRYGQLLTQPEMKDLVQRLMACDQPYFTEKSRSTILTIQNTFLERQFV